ncbi:hypothetical protein SDC9_197364 [bioreactor metagenome]|uniref:Uncharacterized protein n=1 Tax=bioreactor metagenome TaxID=1076179 RepID=A0A645IFY6_9ZZZZ
MPRRAVRFEPAAQMRRQRLLGNQENLMSAPREVRTVADDHFHAARDVVVDDQKSDFHNSGSVCVPVGFLPPVRTAGAAE